MANEFIIRKGYKSLAASEVTGSLKTTGDITVSGTGLSTIAGQLYVGQTSDYFGSATNIQLNSGASNKNVGIRSNILYLYSYNNNSTSKLIFGDGSANFGLFSSDTNFQLYNYGTSTTSLTIDRSTNLTTFTGTVSAEDNIHLTDAGTVRAKLLLNASDRDNVELRAESLGSTMKFFTAGTEALELDASQNATFAGTVLIDGVSNYTGLTVKGSGGSRPAVNFTNATQGNLGTIFGTEARAVSIGTGATGVIALTLDSSQNATFTSTVYIPSKLEHTGDSDTYLNFSTDTITLVAGGNSTTFAGNGTATFPGDITISNATPALNLTDTDNSSNIAFSSVGGALVVNSPSDQVYQIGGTEKFRIGSSTSAFAGNVTVAGTLTAQEFHTEFVSASIVFESGSTKFGDTSDDIHSFTGSLRTTGNVGIGTPSPAFKLDVAGEIKGTTSIRVDAGSPFFGLYTSGTEKAYLQWSNSNSFLTLQSDGATRFIQGTSLAMQIASGGNVGIGTATPSALLDVGGGDGTPAATQFRAVIKGTSARTLYLDSDAGGASMWWGNGNTPHLALDSTTGGGGSIWTYASGWTRRMTWKPDGKVGIGTNTPVEKLEVTGQIVSSASNSTTATSGVERAIMDMSAFSATDHSARFGHFRGATAAGAGQLRLYTDSIERLRINASGYVGIGALTPGAKLEVGGANAAIWINPADGAHAGLHFRQADAFKGFVGYNDSADVVNIGMDGSIVKGISINGSHNVGIGETSIDARLHITAHASSGLSNIKLESPGASKWAFGIPASATYFALDDVNDDLTTPKLVVLKTSGFVGIGTPSPGSQLHIKNTSGDNRGIKIENTVTTSYSELSLKAAREFRLGTGGSGSGANAASAFYVYDATTGGTAGHRFEINSAGDVQARRIRSNTAGEVALSLQPTDSTIHYGLRVDQTTNSLNVDRVDGGGLNLFRIDSSGNNHTAGNVYGRSVNQQYSYLYKFGGLFFTWDSDSYGTNTHHSIRSTYGDTFTDSITLNSYNHIRFNIDSNNNNSTSYFEVGDGTTATGNLKLRLNQDGTLLLNGTTPKLTYSATSPIKLSVQDGMSEFETTANDKYDWENSPISILERGNIGTSSADNKYSPNLNFHWSGRVSNSLWMGANGQLNWGSYTSAGVPATDGTFKAAHGLFNSSVEAGALLKFGTNGFADIVNIGTGAIRFKPSGQTLALTLTGANATVAGNLTVQGGTLNLSDGTSFDSIINAGSSLTLNFDSDDNSTGELFRIHSNTTSASNSNKELFKITESGLTNINVMPGHESEGILRLGRHDTNATRYHDIKSYVSSTQASNYLKFSLHGGTENTVADVLTLKGDLSATFAGQVTVSGGTKLGGGSLQVSTDTSFNTSYNYTFRDGVGISNPNSTSFASSSNTVMAIGARSGGTVNTSLITTGAIGVGIASPTSTLHVSGTSNITGNGTFGGKVTSAATAASDASGTLTTKGYVDTTFTSTNGTGDEWKFTLGDESALTGNKWYKVAQVNQGSGGLHIKGTLSNHVESFGTQKIDLLIQGREGGANEPIEITGTVDVLNNATGTSTDKVGIRVIESDNTTSAHYHFYEVYIRTTRYSQAKFHLTKFGTTGFFTSKPSVTSEPAPASGGNVEIDTSTYVEGIYTIVDSEPHLTVKDGTALFSGTVQAPYITANNPTGAANGSAQEVARFVNTRAGATSAYMYIGASSGTDWRLGKNINGTSSNSNFGIAKHSGTVLAMEIDGSNNTTFASIVGIGSTGIYAGTNAALNLPGKGLAIKNDKNGSSNNWSYIENTAAGSEANLNFYTGNNSTALTLDHSGNATFTGNVTLNGDSKAFRLYPSSYDNWAITTDSNGFVIYNETDSRYDLKISESGAATFGGNATFLGKIASAHTVYCNVSISNSYVRVCKVDANTSQISTAIRVTGTSHGSSHVANFTADILVNHYQDVLIRSLSGAYTQASLKVESNNNGDYTLSVKAETGSAATYYFKIEAISDNVTITPTPSSTPATNTTHEHTTVFGSNETGVGGTLAHKFAGEVNMASAKIESDGSAAAGAYLELHHNNNNSTDVCATINLTNNAGGYASIIGGTTGANNTGYIEFKTDNAGTQGTVLTLNGDNSATFAGNITVGGGQILTPAGTNLALNPNTGIVTVGGVIQASGTGNSTFAGSISTPGIVSTLSNSVLISYSGNDSNGNDAGLKIMNDGNDWGAYIRKTSNADYGLRIDSGGANALNIYSTTGGSTKVFNVNGSNGRVTHGGLELTAGTGVDQITEFIMSFQLAANTWTDTGIDGTDLSTGTYAMQLYVEDFGVGGLHYYEYYSATISWYSGSTNSTGVDEIVMHRAGHAPNTGDVQVRTQRASGSDSHDLMLQVKHNLSYTAALNNTSGKIMRFKFRRLM